MTDLFLKVLEMSLTGSVVILVTMLARFILRKRSKRFIMILWAVVALRMLVPVSFESPISVFNYIHFDADVLSEQVRELPAIDAMIPNADEGEVLSDTENRNLTWNINFVSDEEFVSELNAVEPTEEPVKKAFVMPDIRSVLTISWITVTAAIVLYSIARYIILKRKLKDAVRIDKNIYESDKVKSPFVFGIFAPRIYLPEVLDNTEREYILMHENTHVRHGDHIAKIIGMAVVALHWFNPLVWLAFSLFEQDIEMSCDEATISKMSTDIKQAYAISIVSYAKRSNSRKYLVTPLSFSSKKLFRNEVATRVKNIVSYKKGSKITTAIITAVLLFVACTLGFNSETVKAAEPLLDSEVEVEKIIEPPVKRAAPFDYDTAVPKVNALDARNKEITFYRDGKAIEAMLFLPEGEGPHKTIVMSSVVFDDSVFYIASKVRDSGYSVIAFEADVPKSTFYAPVPQNYRLFPYMLDMYAVIDELRYLPDVDMNNIYMYVDDIGGSFATYLATDRPGEIKGMVQFLPFYENLITLSNEPVFRVRIFDIMTECQTPTAIILDEEAQLCYNATMSLKVQKTMPDCHIDWYKFDDFDSSDFLDNFAKKIAASFDGLPS